MNRIPKQLYPRLKKRNITGMRYVNKTESAEENKSFFQEYNIDIAVLIAILTAASYAIVYFYKFAQFKYYHIPIELIDINLKSVIWILLLFIPIGFILFFISMLTINNVILNKIFSNKFFLRTLNAMLATIIITVSNSISSQIFTIEFFEKINLSLTFSIISSFATLVVLFLKTLQISRSSILKMKLTLVTPIITLRSILLKLKSKFVIFKFVTLSIFLLVLIPYYLGFCFSYFSTYHYVIKGPSDSVVLTTYKDNFIVAPVNFREKTITPELSFVPIKFDKDIKMKVRSVRTGLLQVKEPFSIKELTN